MSDVDPAAPVCPPFAALWRRRSEWLVLDTETTGLDAGAEVVEVAVVDANGASRFHSVVRPAVASLETGATSVHGLDDRSLRHAPSWTEIAPLFLSAVGGQRLLAFNAPFDRRVLNATAERVRGKRPAPKSWTCIMRLYVEHRMPKGAKRSRCSLDEALCREGLRDTARAHRALADARAVVELIRLLGTGERY